MKCSNCGKTKDRVVYREQRGGAVVRVRRCAWCKSLAETKEPNKCPECGGTHTTIIGGTQDMGMMFSRYRVCNDCACKFRTYEEWVIEKHVIAS